MEKAFGRHVAESKSISGVYLAESGDEAEANARVIAMTRAFAENDGRPSAHSGGQDRPGRPRPRPEDHRLGVRRSRLRGRDRPPVRHAGGGRGARGGEHVHIVGVSSLAAGHLALAPALKAALRAVGLGEAMVVVGGVVPEQDFAPLRAAGVDAIFPPGTVVAEAALSLIERLTSGAVTPARRGLRRRPSNPGPRSTRRGRVRRATCGALLRGAPGACVSSVSRP